MLSFEQSKKEKAPIRKKLHGHYWENIDCLMCDAPDRLQLNLHLSLFSSNVNADLAKAISFIP